MIPWVIGFLVLGISLSIKGDNEEIRSRLTHDPMPEINSKKTYVAPKGVVHYKVPRAHIDKAIRACKRATKVCKVEIYEAPSLEFTFRKAVRELRELPKTY